MKTNVINIREKKNLYSYKSKGKIGKRGRMAKNKREIKAEKELKKLFVKINELQKQPRFVEDMKRFIKLTS